MKQNLNITPKFRLTHFDNALSGFIYKFHYVDVCIRSIWCPLKGRNAAQLPCMFLHRPNEILVETRVVSEAYLHPSLSKIYVELQQMIIYVLIPIT